MRVEPVSPAPAPPRRAPPRRAAGDGRGAARGAEPAGSGSSRISAPCIPTIGSRSPSSRANGSAELAIRPVTIATATPRLDGGAHCGHGPRPDPQVVADHRAVQVERHEPDPARTAARRRGTGGGHGVRPAGPRGRRDPGDPGQPGEVRHDVAAPAGQERSDGGGNQASPGPTPISRSASPPSLSRSGSAPSRRRMTSRPSGPPSSASAWLELDRRREAGEIDRCGCRAGWRRRGRSAPAREQPRGDAGLRHEVGDGDPDAVRHAVGDRVLPGERGRLRPTRRTRRSRPRRPSRAAEARPRSPPRWRRCPSRRPRP